MSYVSEVDAGNWEQEVSKSDTLTVVYFWHEQCPYCLRLSPIIEELAEKYEGKIKFVKLNVLVDEFNRETAENFGVMSTPTLMFTCSGRPVGQIVGLLPEEVLAKSFDDMLGRYKQCLRQSTELRPSYIV